MLSVNCFQLCANCSTSSGLTLPCSSLGCSSLGHFSTLVTAHWPTQSLRVPAVKSSLAVKVSLISNLGSEFQPWRLLSCGISSPEFSVVYGGFARYGRGRSSTPTSVPVIRLRGPRSAFVESISSG
uniref:Uncharacterized protein n=1 Tax=Opuntia streptacantha TaxID=393608 RepID=A0A7C9F9T4_OPUST